MRLKSKKYVDNIDFAYDIEVKDNHNYTINNVVVHNCKNPTSMQGRAILTLTNKAKYMVAMSGTPLMNNPLDLYFPMKWLGYENHSFYQFKQHYCKLGGWGGSQVVGYKNLEEIRAMMDNIMLRRLKTEVLDLPEKIRKIEYVDMTPKQNQIKQAAELS